MKFYDRARPLYLETDASGISCGAGLLHVRDGMNCGCDGTPNNTILHPIAFATKSLSSVEQFYGNVEYEALGILHWLEIFTINTYEDFSFCLT